MTKVKNCREEVFILIDFISTKKTPKLKTPICTKKCIKCFKSRSLQNGKTQSNAKVW